MSELRACKTCGDVFTAFQPGRRECVECWMKHDSYDDTHERQKSRARQLIVALKRRRDES